MNLSSLILASAADTAATLPTSKGHELTWPYWGAILLGAILAVVLPFLWTNRRPSLRRPPCL